MIDLTDCCHTQLSVLLGSLRDVQPIKRIYHLSVYFQVPFLEVFNRAADVRGLKQNIVELITSLNIKVGENHKAKNTLMTKDS